MSGRLEVVAVEDDRAQILCSALSEARHELRVERTGRRADRRTRVRTVEPATSDSPTAGPPRSGAVAVEVEELDPATDYVATLRSPSGETIARRRFTTVPAGRGEELVRFATISDLHLGRGAKQYRGPLARPSTEDQTRHAADTDPTVVCARAAIDEALAWGAELLVVKGDVCEESHAAAWDTAAELLGDLPVPVLILPGNHDTGGDRHFEPEIGAAERGLHVTRGVEHVDVDGLRIVLADSTKPGNGWGAVARHGGHVAELAGGADGGVFVATHHQAQRFGVPLYWPHGIPGADARDFARQVVRANPKVLASSGHTHRCRVRRVAGMAWSEVSATNHFPGMWAGYRVDEGGIAQTARRIASPDALAWCESTRSMFGGTWARWAPGTLSDRSFRIDW